MDAVRLFALLIYTFGAFAYGAMLLMWVRELGAVGWGTRRSDAGSAREADAVNGALLVVSLVWFVCNAAQLLVGLTPLRRMWQLDVAGVLLAFAFPPLIMHVTWAEVTLTHAARPSPGWRLALWPVYAICAILPVWMLALSYGAVDGRLVAAAGRAATVGLSLAFIAAAGYSIALVTQSARVDAPARHGRSATEARQARWSLVGLFGAMATIFLFMLWVAAISGGDRAHLVGLAALLEVAAKSLPLVFVFVSTYFEDRFQFFDLFVKRGAGFLLAIGVLTVWFALILPVTRPLQDTWAAPWIYAVALMPAVGAISWMYRRAATVLDRRWLGRRYSTVDALTRFVSALRSVTSRPEAVQRAEEALSEIFGAPASVRLGTAPPGAAAFDTRQQLAVEGAAGLHGAILMGRRASEAPYFSQDVTLLSSLAGILAAVLDNLDLQQRRHEQEQRAHDLTLHASRSELKALRAQINPHFLFNALNAIAGLIHRNPARADRTIEQLAEVFRYALRSSDDEWTALGDELQFVRSYLDVERARFGERLQAHVQAGDNAARLRIPTMMVQTLVENAVKHGLTEVRGAAAVGVDAHVTRDRLVISVTDNGPGFTRDALGATDRLPAGGGYGLANIRHRLRGYFGDAAALIIGRDDERGLTIVTLEMPLAADVVAAARTRETVL
jgi:signal transduction histidine kinase